MNPTPPSDRPTVWPLYVVTFLATYTIAVASISAPGIQHSLEIPETRTSLVIGAYSATFAAGLIMSGRLGDRYGRRRMFQLGTAGLAITAFLTAAAPNLELLLIARLLQGCAAAATTPQVLSSIQAILTGERRLRAVGLYSVFAGSGTVGGQVIGGVVNSGFGPEFGWRAAFGSVGVLAIFAWVGARYLTETRSPNPMGLDLRGSIILGISLFLLIAGLTNSAGIDLGSPLSPPGPLVSSAVLLAAAALGLGLLVPHSRGRERAGKPSILPARVMREPGVRLGVTLSCLLFLMIGGFMYNFAILSQIGLGYTPLESGLATLTLALAFVTSSAIAPRLVSRAGGPARGGPRVLLFASVLQACGLASVGLIALLGLSPFAAWFMVAAVLIGGGQGLMLGPLVSVVMTAVPDEVAGLTGGLIATAQQTGIGLGIAILSTVFAGLAQILPMPAAYGITTLGTVVLSLVFAFATVRLRAHGRGV